MTRKTTHHDWAFVEPKIQADLDKIKDALLTAGPEEIVRLQAEAKALTAVIKYFDAPEPAERRLSDSDPRY